MGNAVAASLWSESILAMDEKQSHQVKLSPLSNFIGLRFDHDIDVVNILKEVIKSVYFPFPISKISDIELETSPNMELRVFKKPRRRGEQPIAIFPMCWYDLHMKDPFFGLAVRNVAGLPRYTLTANVTLLRNLLIYLNNNKIRYEIW